MQERKHGLPSENSQNSQAQLPGPTTARALHVHNRRGNMREHFLAQGRWHLLLIVWTLALSFPAAGPCEFYFTIESLNNQVLVALRNTAKKQATLEICLTSIRLTFTPFVSSVIHFHLWAWRGVWKSSWEAPSFQWGRPHFLLFLFLILYDIPPQSWEAMPDV